MWKRKPIKSKQREYQKLPTYFTKEEIDKLLEASNVTINPKRNHLIINLLWQTGTRVSEMLSLKPSSIDRKMEVVRIYTLKKKSGYIPIRAIPIKQDLVDEIDSYTSENSIKEDSCIIQVTRQTVFNVIKEVCRQAGFDDERAHPHTLRHSFAVHCILSKAPLLVVSKWLGHTDIGSTQIYTQVTGIDTREIMDQIRF